MTVSDLDTIPVVDEWVSLHRISAGGGAMIDSSQTNRLGIYVLRATDADTSSLYISSIQYRDVTYFSAPIRSSGLSADTVGPLFVFDTSSTGPQLTISQRHVVVRERNDAGQRSVLELIVLANEGTLTRIANGQAQPVWRHMLPSGVTNLQVGESDVSPDAIQRSGDTLALFAPVPPGQKQLVFSYTMSEEREFAVPVSQPANRFQLLLEDTLAVVDGPVNRVGTEQMEGLRFARYDAGPVAAGVSLRIDFRGAPFDIVNFWWVIVAATSVAFATVTWLWWRRIERVPASSDDPDVLAARIALLDENFERERDAMSDGDRTAYENTRAELKARLNIALARRTYQR